MATAVDLGISRGPRSWSPPRGSEVNSCCGVEDNCIAENMAVSGPQGHDVTNGSQVISQATSVPDRDTDDRLLDRLPVETGRHPVNAEDSDIGVASGIQTLTPFSTIGLNYSKTLSVSKPPQSSSTAALSFSIVRILGDNIGSTTTAERDQIFSETNAIRILQQQMNPYLSSRQSTERAMLATSYPPRIAMSPRNTSIAGDRSISFRVEKDCSDYEVSDNEVEEADIEDDDDDELIDDASKSRKSDLGDDDFIPDNELDLAVCRRRRLSVVDSSQQMMDDDNSTGNTAEKIVTTGGTSGLEQLSWLQCTRYKPPKLPRSKKLKDGCRKRKLGRNPRVPFTQHQVTVLEHKFHRTHYLSSVDVAELSAALNLTENRVKIWFQNRRARERRNKDSSTTSLSPTSKSIGSGDLYPLHLTSMPPPPGGGADRYSAVSTVADVSSTTSPSPLPQHPVPVGTAHTTSSNSLLTRCSEKALAAIASSAGSMVAYGQHSAPRLSTTEFYPTAMTAAAALLPHHLPSHLRLSPWPPLRQISVGVRLPGGFTVAADLLAQLSACSPPTSAGTSSNSVSSGAAEMSGLGLMASSTPSGLGGRRISAFAPSLALPGFIR